MKVKVDSITPDHNISSDKENYFKERIEVLRMAVLGTSPKINCYWRLVPVIWPAPNQKGESRMKSINNQLDEPTIEITYAAELFSELPVSAQDQIIDFIKSLLSDDKKA